MNEQIIISIVKNLIPADKRDQILANLQSATSSVLTFETRLKNIEVLINLIAQSLNISLPAQEQSNGVSPPALLENKTIQ